MERQQQRQKLKEVDALTDIEKFIYKDVQESNEECSISDQNLETEIAGPSMVVERVIQLFFLKVHCVLCWKKGML